MHHTELDEMRVSARRESRDEYLATYASRVLAGLIDGVLAYPLAVICSVFVGVVRPVRPEMTGFEQWAAKAVSLAFIVGLPLLIVRVVSVGSGCSSVGQRIAGIQVVLEHTGGPPGFLRSLAGLALAVVVLPLVPLCILGAVVHGKPPAGGAWHDRLTGTVVVKRDLWRTRNLTACKRCGYDLRGSLAFGRCPECGESFHPPGGEET